MKKSYIDYAMSVIVQRALPDVRDGLKPVHRRILYTMKELNNFHDRPHKKSARIVGDVLGKYHPHGDSSVYDAMVRLSQDFNMQAPLVDGHGNFGSIDGDGAAAMRYTEARLSPISLEMLKDLDAGFMETMPNFDNTLTEPTILPSRFPNLLVNGSSGIAVGMATSIPSHNLREVVNGAIALIDNPRLTVKQLMKYISGPDFPTGGIIANKEDLLQIYTEGKGKIRIRAKLEVGKDIIVTEIPYTLAGNKTKILEDVIKLMTEKKLDEVSEIRDESSKDGLRIVIETKRGVSPEKLAQKLFKLTKLEDTFSVNLLAIKDKRPESYNLKTLLFEYTEFLKDIHHKRLNVELSKLKSRKEVVDGLIQAIGIIDLIIEAIRGGENLKDVKNCLMYGKTENITFKTKRAEKEASKLAFTDVQATAILSMQLQRLIGLELNKLMKELEELRGKMRVIEEILSDEKNFCEHIKEDLRRLKKEYGKSRRTQIDTLNEPEIIEDEKPEEKMYALIDKSNYIKVVDSNSYNRMSKEESLTVFEVLNTESLKVFTADGLCHQIKIQEIPLSKSKDRGTPVELIIEDRSAQIIAILPGSSKVMFTTLKGFVKQVGPEEFCSRNKSIKATKLDDKDRVISVLPVLEGFEEVVITTKDGKSLRMNLIDVPIQKRTAKGVTGINLNVGDSVTGVVLEMPTSEKKRRRGAKGK